MSGEFELTTQRMSSVEKLDESNTPLHPPLTDIEHLAPDTSLRIYQPDEVSFPLSNDDCTAGYFEQLAVRSETAEYQSAKSRVAVLVGESALAANLKYIPEETILLLDNSPHMNIFMEEYVKSLRESSGSDDWRRRLEVLGPSDVQSFIRFNIRRWGAEERKHPLADTDAFLEAQSIARQKVIVPWNADITDCPALERLGDVLEERQAAVTMMNLTNVLSFVKFFRSPNECAEYLQALPITPNAPILTTSMRPLSGGHPGQVTGPFFGLDNLARAATAHTAHALGAINERQSVSKPEEVVDESDNVLELLSKLKIVG